MRKISIIKALNISFVSSLVVLFLPILASAFSIGSSFSGVANDLPNSVNAKIEVDSGVGDCYDEFHNLILKNNQRAKFYLEQKGMCNKFQYRTCTNGSLSGDYIYKFKTCVHPAGYNLPGVGDYTQCVGTDGKIYNKGDKYYRYKFNKGACDQKKAFYCGVDDNEVGEYKYTSCEDVLGGTDPTSAFKFDTGDGKIDLKGDSGTVNFDAGKFLGGNKASGNTSGQVHVGNSSASGNSHGSTNGKNTSGETHGGGIMGAMQDTVSGVVGGSASIGANANGKNSANVRVEAKIDGVKAETGVTATGSSAIQAQIQAQAQNENKARQGNKETIRAESVMKIAQQVKLKTEVVDSYLQSALVRSGADAVIDASVNTVDGKQVLTVKTKRHAKLLGMFGFDLEMDVEVDVKTGEVVNVHRPWYSFLMF